MVTIDLIIRLCDFKWCFLVFCCCFFYCFAGDVVFLTENRQKKRKIWKKNYISRKIKWKSMFYTHLIGVNSLKNWYSLDLLAKKIQNGFGCDLNTINVCRAQRLNREWMCYFILSMNTVQNIRNNSSARINVIHTRERMRARVFCIPCAHCVYRRQHTYLSMREHCALCW